MTCEQRYQSESDGGLKAVADNELDAAQRRAAMTGAAGDPQANRRVVHQQQLREAVGRVMGGDGAAPVALRDQLHALARQTPGAEPQTSRPESPVVLASLGRWLPTAVAALFFVAAVTVFFSVERESTYSGVISQARLDLFARRHVSCTRMIEELHQAAGLPSQVQALPAALSTLFGQNAPGLDLSAIGYRFDRVGHCTVPGAGSVHLIYRNVDGAAMSLWMNKDNGGAQIEAGHIYTIADASKAHPILMWKQGGLVFYLVGDAMEATQKAAKMLRQAV